MWNLGDRELGLLGHFFKEECLCEQSKYIATSHYKKPLSCRVELDDNTAIFTNFHIEIFPPHPCKNQAQSYEFEICLMEGF